MKDRCFSSILPHMRILTLVVCLLCLTACAPTGQMSVPVGRFASVPAQAEASTGDTEGLAPANPTVVDAAGQASQTEPAQGESEGAGKVRMIRSEPRQLEFPKPPDPAERFRATDKITLTAEKMPARNFVSYVFGELLKVNFVLVDGTAGLDSPVSLSSQVPISSRRLYQLATEMLSSVGLSVIEKEGVFFVGPADSRTGFGLPVGYGRTAADVPNVPGQILQLMP
ncbi:MAG: hypothetical protein FJ184_12480, partial [Gammaproteobacteria bacterium]|nr:hypothetical protein [Gammaproteobacteria bacterium]